ncbi:hypothetical protein L484_003923 [Morus notabilis]|uniref:Uncharacterized protein n=1 Tax=Morus notabilis TaxID=981085 RepID=W9R8U9_9ROSA|nr:hypothetical protein L484_003923 [Morus notabilis]
MMPRNSDGKDGEEIKREKVVKVFSFFSLLRRLYCEFQGAGVRTAHGWCFGFPAPGEGSQVLQHGSPLKDVDGFAAGGKNKRQGMFFWHPFGRRISALLCTGKPNPLGLGPFILVIPFRGLVVGWMVRDGRGGGGAVVSLLASLGLVSAQMSLFLGIWLRFSDTLRLGRFPCRRRMEAATSARPSPVTLQDTLQVLLGIFYFSLIASIKTFVVLF